MASSTWRSTRASEETGRFSPATFCRTIPQTYALRQTSSKTSHATPAKAACCGSSDYERAHELARSAGHCLRLRVVGIVWRARTAAVERVGASGNPIRGAYRGRRIAAIRSRAQQFHERERRRREDRRIAFHDHELRWLSRDRCRRLGRAEPLGRALALRRL